MAEPVRIDWKDIGVGALIVAAVSIILFLIVGTLNLPVPQWLISGLGGAIGVAVWFWLKRRTGGSK
jgi:uncharacterized membrane protein YjjB (DUF3815 family)